jgi:glycosyltransferase involved in cell wall biosynthesis
VKLSVVVPVYNERATIERVVAAIGAVALPGDLEREIVIVDDCSTDGTRDVLAGLAQRPGIRVVHHEVNQGKGAALRTGFAQVTGDIVVVQDADLEYDPAEHPKLVQPILDGRADVVYGSRFITGKPISPMPLTSVVANRTLTMMSNLCTGLRLTDMETCHKAFRAEVLRKIRVEENRFGFEPEVTAKIAKLKVRVQEVGIGFNGRTYAEGKKITWRDGVRAMRCIVKYSARNNVR